jgi:murein DD-endopeptidase MepM/ murein hydrolase activator NlpD
LRPEGTVSKSLTFVAMIFIAGMAVATSVPANAVAPSASGVPSLAAPSEKPAVTVAKDAKAKSRDQAKATPQKLAVSSVPVPVVIRDSYSSELVLKYTAVSGKTSSIVLPADAGAIMWPVPKTTRISDGFGWRVAPTAGASSDHQGVDFDPGNGFPIQAISAGVVREVVPTDNGGLGVHVTVDHVINGSLVSSVYGHMQIGSVKVEEGQTVNAGDVIGLVGSTGVSTGPHLHFEIRPGGTDPVDPVAWLKETATL